MLGQFLTYFPKRSGCGSLVAKNVAQESFALCSAMENFLGGCPELLVTLSSLASRSPRFDDVAVDQAVSQVRLQVPVHFCFRKAFAVILFGRQGKIWEVGVRLEHYNACNTSLEVSFDI